MNAREKLLNTLQFKNCTDGGGAVLETFQPWDLTVERFAADGMPIEPAVLDAIKNPGTNSIDSAAQYFDIRLADGVAEYEAYFHFDKMYRMFFYPPLPKYQLGQRPPVVDAADWERIKQEAEAVIQRYHTDETIRRLYARFREPQRRGECSIRFGIPGFFWVPRDLFGIAEHLLALYDEPELMHDIISWLCEYYIQYLDKIFEYIQPDVLYIMEDLSGTNGPMLSPAHFDEYIGAYYQKLIPFLKSKGVANVFVDTDGDFKALIPNFIKSGVDGFLPMDVNAGMDIVAVRKEYPHLKFIGAFNKLVLIDGPEAIDREFQRLLPVIRQGGYIPGCDHQAAPSTPLLNYQYYVEQLRRVMQQAGADL